MSTYSTIPASVHKRPTPFKVDIPDGEIADFKQLLKLSRIPRETYENRQEDRRFGLSRAWMINAKKIWEEYDWKKSEAHINAFPNFTSSVTTEAGTFTTHFVALFSTSPTAAPLVFLHGWPGSFLEFLPILSLLQARFPDPASLPYHIVVPSLPGYAFSSPPPLDREFAARDIAVVMDQLMRDLGFEGGYIAQGGDIGSRVAKVLGGDEFPSCKAAHVNFNYLASAPAGLSTSSLSEREQAMLARGQEFVTHGSGYANMHGTRPSTIGLVLGSSPLALLAWIGEKLLAWTDEDPSLETILESVSLYWFTRTFESSIYPYRTRFLPKDEQPVQPYVKVPFGFSNFPKELIPVPKSWAATEGNLVFYREHSKGGHFAALEQPEVLLGDIEDFVRQVWKV
ncbi:epoxide hydrolase [Diplocarpon mali]|nr:epoxide hydrolase [Diplocarpon mali]